MIPEGWEHSTVARVSAVPVSYGVVQTGEPVEKGVPCVRVVDIANGDLNPASMITTSQEISAAYSRTVLKEGDLMIALRGIIGQTAQVTSELEGCNLTRGIARISPKKGAVTSDFLLQSLNGPEFKNLINRQANGSALQEISIATLRKAPVLLPPISEQRRIAETLKTWDRVIETVEALIANARAQKQALMQQLLPQGTTPPKKRLPGFSGEWRETSLAELLSVKRAKGKIVPTNEGGDGVPYIGSTSFLGEFSNFTTSNDALLCVETDILVLWDGEYAGKVATGLTGAVSSTVGRYRLAKAKADPLFVVTLMEKASERIRSIREGSGIPHMPGDFEHWFKFALPTLDEQKAIAEVFNSNRVIADELQAQLTALRHEKAALMQQLLTGKRRVKPPENEVA